MPAIITRYLPNRIPTTMAAYTATFVATGAVGSGIVVPISLLPRCQGVLGWRWALLLVILVLAVQVWVGALVGGERFVLDAPARAAARRAP